MLVEKFEEEREARLTVAAWGELWGTACRGQSCGRVGNTDLNITNIINITNIKAITLQS